MKMTRSAMLLAVAALLASSLATAGESAPRKKALVELFTSQGCDSCPAAEQVFGKLEALGYGPDRIVPIAFHVDYFNDPWKDVFSDPIHSRREMAYNEVQNRKDLYFTPMLMVDGRVPMLGSNRPAALAALRQVLAEKPGAAIVATLQGDDPKASRKTLTVKVEPLGREILGRELLVGVALFENPVTTDVRSGENAGKRLVEHFAVRKFVFQGTTFEDPEAKALTFPVEVPADGKAEGCGIAVFVQDVKSGVVYQADSVPWLPPTDAVKKSRR
jgi:hypothetical protein